MGALAGQIAAVVAGALVLRALLRRTGVELPVVQATGTAIVVLLAVVGIGSLRQSVRVLNAQRAANVNPSRDTARRICVYDLHLDTAAVTWAEAQIPPRARYYFDGPISNPQSPPGFTTVDLCLRYVLLPRLQVGTLAEARYVLFWGRMSPAVTAAVRRRHGVLRRLGPGYAVATLP